MPNQNYQEPVYGLPGFQSAQDYQEQVHGPPEFYNEYNHPCEN